MKFSQSVDKWIWLNFHLNWIHARKQKRKTKKWCLIQYSFQKLWNLGRNLTAKSRLLGIFAQYHIKTLLQIKRQINHCKMTRSYWLISWHAYQYSFVPFQISVSARLRIQISRLSFVLATRVKVLRETARSEPKERSLYSQTKAVRKKSDFMNYNALSSVLIHVGSTYMC